MSKRIRRYKSKNIDVTYDTGRCIHVAACIRGLPAVFDTRKRPWVQPAQSDADAVADVVMRCPTGALHFERKDDGAAEPVPARNTITPMPNGPLFARGNIIIETADGEIILQDTRVALCRCGASENKPFCDNSHIAGQFRDAGQVAGNEEPAVEIHSPALIVLTRNGPLWLRGNVEISAGDESALFRTKDVYLCRCGGSKHKPFCDDTHTKNGFIG